MDGALRIRDEEARRREDELNRVRKEIAVLTDGISVRDGEVLRLHEELSEKEEEIRRKEAEGRKREEALRKRESEVERLQGDLAEAEEELKRKGEALRRAARQESGHQGHGRNGEGNASTSATSTSSVRSGHSVHSARVASNTAYSALSEHIALNRSSEAFLTRTDTWSGAQVIQAVQDINSLILQFAASVAEIGRFFVREVDADGGVAPSKGAGVEGTRSYADTLQRLGPALTKLLATYDHSNDPILVQLALQMLVCVASKKAWETFCLGLPGKSDGVLSVIYRSVRELEPQPTSAKWRSLTHSHIHSIYPTLAAYSANELAETILRWTVDILVLAGCAPSSIPNPNQLFALTRPRILPSLIHLTRALTTLENVLRQDVLSTSFDLVIPEFGSTWNPRVMSDMFGAGAGGMGAASGPHAPKTSTGGRVLGCVEIGLGCRTRMGPIAQQPPANTPPESGKPEVVYDERLLLQPKVVLESVVDLL
ncbi:hypothetical protein BKA70DRAFT_1097030 [Coprinopsis sp. MPI-PUGE-AT-0042]|nr:hypothetical protein BKA70DRAFT_1097030 [Coprinopsis sp. MPI-PUGE-AT-0042]